MGDDSPTSSASSGSQNDPLYGAVPPPTSNNVAPAFPREGDGVAAPRLEESNDPLFGAPVSSDQGVGMDTPKTWVESTSQERVHSLKSARDAIHSQKTPPTLPARLQNHQLHRRDPTSIPTFLKRITFILSLVLGLSSVVAGIFSLFLLPRLHSSFSARLAIVSQQEKRMEDVLERLKRIRGNRIYALESSNTSETSTSEDGKRTKESTVEEIPSAPVLTPDLQPLPPLLKSLQTNLENTSTTRTSLLSSLSNYTAHLHNELFTARSGFGFGSGNGLGRGGFGGMGVGMGSLGESLRKEGAGASGGGEGKGGEEWDAVRKEVRAIKGLLLNRRSFAHVNNAHP